MKKKNRVNKKEKLCLLSRMFRKLNKSLAGRGDCHIGKINLRAREKIIK